MAPARKSRGPRQHLAIGVHGARDEPLFHLSTATVASGDFEDPPPAGWLICRIHQLPLVSGSYPLNLFLALDGEVSDWIEGGAVLDVESCDFFGTGRLPPEGQGPFVVGHAWRCEPVFDQLVPSGAA